MVARDGSPVQAQFEMHIVKKTFLTRHGQFRSGERSEALGISDDVLNRRQTHTFKLRGSQDTYSASSQEIKDFANRFNSWWRNQRGQRLAIVPVFFFKEKMKKEEQLDLFKPAD